MPLTDFQARLARLLATNDLDYFHDSVERAAEAFILSRPPEETGCLYYSTEREVFVEPTADTKAVVPHYGRPCGVLPRILEPDA